MKNKVNVIIACLALLCAVGAYFYFNVDMTGKPYGEIEAYRAAHPNKNVTYRVMVAGDTPITLKHNTTAATADLSHVDSLLAQAEYLQNLTELQFPEEVIPAETLSRLMDAFPNAAVSCSKVRFLERDYSQNITEIDLSFLTPDQTEEAIIGIRVLPALETVVLYAKEDVSPLPLAEAAALYASRPDVKFQYRTELFGQVLTTDMARVEYFKEPIYDEGLEQFRLLLPMMYNLTYLKLDWCKTSDEAMAQLREDYADRFKVVWRVFFGVTYNVLTDSYKIWANWTVNDRNNEALKYCNEAKYVDLGHNVLTHCEWARNMPDLEVLILGDTNLKSLEPLKGCKKLTFLELFHTKVTDLTPLAELTELQYLNISEVRVTDISPIYQLDNMIHVNALLNYTIPEEQIKTYKELQPQCETHFLPYGNATKYNWRYDNNGHILPRYALLRQQFGYSAKDDSRYPGGYLREEITYESTGITPPEVRNPNE